MQFNFTPILKAFCYKGFLSIFFLSFLVSGINAQPFINGALSTGSTTSGGTAAPAGFTWSELQGTNTALGTGANISAGITVIDDFIVPAGVTWNITKITFYAYSTGYVGTTSPFNDSRLRIYNSNPSTGSPVPVFGDLTTNRLSSSTTANMFRIGNNAPGTTRQIWKIELNITTSLTAGTYWLEWQHGTIAGVTSNFSPLKTITGQSSQPGDNARQRDLNADTFTNLVDGTPASPQDLPFQIDYTATGVPCTATPPGNTLSTLATACPTIPFMLSVQNPGSGLGLSYQWSSSLDNVTYTNIAGATNPSYTTTQTASTWYRLQVTCGANPAQLSTPIQVMRPAACYCIPSATDCTDGDLITNVTLNSLNNNTTCGDNGYTDYTINAAITVPDVYIGAVNPITITAGTGTFTESVGVWIDYNRNSTFEASEFTLIGTAAVPTVRNGSINVPSTATAGPTRMRVRVRFATALTGTAACLTYVYGETEDYTVNIVPCVPVTLTAQPTNATITCGGNASFSVTAAGSLPTYQWQVRTSATAPWTTISNNTLYSGVTTRSLTVTNVPESMNGYQYRAIFGGGCNGPDFSSPATLTVNPFTLAITPANGNICAGGAALLLAVPNNSNVATFTNSIAGTIPDGDVAGITRTFNVSGITGTVLSMRLILNVAHPYASDVITVLKAPNNNVLNLNYAVGATAPSGTNFTNTAFTSAPGAPALSSGSAPWTGSYRPDAQVTNIGIPTGPTGFDANVASFPLLYSVANGTWTLAMYDYGTPDQGSFTSATLEITYGSAPATATFAPVTGLFTNAAATTAYTGTAVSQVYAKPTASTTYTATVSTATCSKTQQIPVVVSNPITGTATTTNRSVCVGGTTSFTAVGNNLTGDIILHQWKVSSDAGATFTNVTNGGVYSGATTSTLTITGATAALNGNRYKDSLYVTACASNIFSSTATLTVNPLPTITVTSPLSAIYVGQTTTLTATVSPNAAATYVWLRNGEIVPGATSSTFAVDVDKLGSYTVRVTDVNGCVSTSAARVITAAANDNLFVYPSPNTGQFQVRFFSSGSNTSPRTINIYDSKGTRVYSRVYAINASYTRQDVDLSYYGKGIYSVELIDGGGKRLKTGRVIVL